jgi:NADP-dependent alcohol dehydrogenase
VAAEKIDDLVAALEKHGMTRLGETGEVTLEVSRRILEAAL